MTSLGKLPGGMMVCSEKPAFRNAPGFCPFTEDRLFRRPGRAETWPSEEPVFPDTRRGTLGDSRPRKHRGAKNSIHSVTLDAERFFGAKIQTGSDHSQKSSNSCPRVGAQRDCGLKVFGAAIGDNGISHRINDPKSWRATRNGSPQTIRNSLPTSVYHSADFPIGPRATANGKTRFRQGGAIRSLAFDSDYPGKV